MQSDAAAGVGHLVVVFEKTHERGARTRTRVGAAPLLLPRIPLALIQEVPPRHRRELLGSAVVVRAVRPVLTGQGDKCGVVPVLVPDPIETARSALTDVRQERYVLRLVLADDEETTGMRDRPGMPRQFVDDVLGRAIDD